VDYKNRRSLNKSDYIGTIDTLPAVYQLPLYVYLLEQGTAEQNHRTTGVPGYDGQGVQVRKESAGGTNATPADEPPHSDPSPTAGQGACQPAAPRVDTTVASRSDGQGLQAGKESAGETNGAPADGQAHPNVASCSFYLLTEGKYEHLYRVNDTKAWVKTREGIDELIKTMFDQVHRLVGGIAEGDFRRPADECDGCAFRSVCRQKYMLE
jgi:hypothetical protein